MVHELRAWHGAHGRCPAHVADVARTHWRYATSSLALVVGKQTSTRCQQGQCETIHRRSHYVVTRTKANSPSVAKITDVEDAGKDMQNLFVTETRVTNGKIKRKHSTGKISDVEIECVRDWKSSQTTFGANRVVEPAVPD